MMKSILKIFIMCLVLCVEIKASECEHSWYPVTLSCDGVPVYDGTPPSTHIYRTHVVPSDKSHPVLYDRTISTGSGTITDHYTTRSH